MTTVEKLAMYKEKRAFIKSLNKAFEMRPAGSTVESIDYEVYSIELQDGVIHYKEFVIVNFYGGGKSVKTVNGNSNTANFRALGTMLDGGYYDEMYSYETLTDIGYELVEL